jgi:hypothetical protein
MAALLFEQALDGGFNEEGSILETRALVRVLAWHVMRQTQGIEHLCAAWDVKLPKE